MKMTYRLSKPCLDNLPMSLVQVRVSRLEWIDDCSIQIVFDQVVETRIMVEKVEQFLRDLQIDIPIGFDRVIDSVRIPQRVSPSSVDSSTMTPPSSQYSDDEED
jgi:hypothetical protein